MDSKFGLYRNNPLWVWEPTQHRLSGRLVHPDEHDECSDWTVHPTASTVKMNGTPVFFFLVLLPDCFVSVIVFRLFLFILFLFLVAHVEKAQYYLRVLQCSLPASVPGTAVLQLCLA
jgi:hypothetical protein